MAASSSTDETAAAAARAARRWASLAMLIAFVFVIVTVIDNGIKRDVIRQVTAARRLLDEFRETANGALTRAADSGADPDRGDDLVRAAGVETPPPGNGRASPRAGGGGAGGKAGRAAGDG